MGVFSDRTSIERILFAVFTHGNRNQGVSTPFLLTQNSWHYPNLRFGKSSRLGMLPVTFH